MSENKQKTHWINWFIPSMLIIAALSVLVFYKPAPTTQIITTTNTATSKNPSEPNPKELASVLVSTYFNGTTEDTNELKNSLEQTLNDLSNTDDAQIKLAFDDLKNNNFNSAIKTLKLLSSKQKNLPETAKTWINIGNIQNLSSARQALLAYQKASELDPKNSIALTHQAHIYRQLKQFSQAEKIYKKLQALGNQDIANKALSFSNLGILNQSKGDFKKAESNFSEALKIYTDIEDEVGVADTNEKIANLFANTERFEEAERHYLQALTIYQKLENPQNLAIINNALGSTYQTLKLSKKAQSHYETALEISLNNNLQTNMASLYSNLGVLAQQNGKEEQSQRYFAKSLEFNKDAKRSNQTADRYANLAILNRKEKNYQESENFYKQAIDIYKFNNHTAGIISQQINLGFLYKVWKKNGQACNIWRDTLIILKQTSSNRTSRVENLLQESCQ